MSTDTYTEAWERVANEVNLGAWGIAWDGCHKTYIAMDQQQHEWFKNSGYEYLDVQSWDTDSIITQLKEWFEKSCELRFINSIHTTNPNPNDGYTTLISQFEFEEYNEEKWMGLHNPERHTNLGTLGVNCLYCESEQCTPNDLCRCCLKTEIETLTVERDTLKAELRTHTDTITRVETLRDQWREQAEPYVDHTGAGDLTKVLRAARHNENQTIKCGKAADDLTRALQQP